MADRTFHIGDEWTDGMFNFIVIDLHADTVETFDSEGMRYLESWEELNSTLDELDAKPVTDPLEDRIAMWRHEHGDKFPL